VGALVEIYSTDTRGNYQEVAGRGADSSLYGDTAHVEFCRFWR
jgi:hypothetical protein